MKKCEEWNVEAFTNEKEKDVRRTCSRRWSDSAGGDTSSSATAEKPRCSVGQFWVAITPYADRPISIKSNQIEIID